MTSLVEIKRNDPVTTSLIVADGLGKTHKSVMQLLRQYETDFKEFGTLAFEMRKSKGRPTEFAYLNEAQVYFLLTLMRNNDQVVLFKKNLVKEFTRMKKALNYLQIQKNSEEWKQSRQIGKEIRSETTEMIQEFVRYATEQGSKNAIRYYSNITSMENKALFILEQKFPNVREMLTNHQLSTLKTADRVVYEALEDGVKDEMHYKDIYKLAKQRVEALAKLIKPTMVISYDEVKVLE